VPATQQRLAAISDVAYSTRCGTSVQCYTAAISEVERNLRTIVQRVHELTAGHLSLVVLLDYWSVWLGGQYAQAQGQVYVDAAATVTDEANTAIKTIAAEAGSAYVDLRAGFKGPDVPQDIPSPNVCPRSIPDPAQPAV
jgi:hypothetical protein